MDFDDIMIYCESLLMHNADVLQQWQEQLAEADLETSPYDTDTTDMRQMLWWLLLLFL